MPTFKPFGVKYIILLGPFHTNLSNESAMVFRLIFRERRVGILCLQLLLYYQNSSSRITCDADFREGFNFHHSFFILNLSKVFIQKRSPACTY